MTPSQQILQLTRRDGETLAAMKVQIGRLESKLDGISGKVDGVSSLVKEIRDIDIGLQDLVRNLPKIVGEAVREALPKRGGKR